MTHDPLGDLLVYLATRYTAAKLDPHYLGYLYGHLRQGKRTTTHTLRCRSAGVPRCVHPAQPLRPGSVLLQQAKGKLHQAEKKSKGIDYCCGNQSKHGRAGRAGRGGGGSGAEAKGISC